VSSEFILFVQTKFELVYRVNALLNAVKRQYGIHTYLLPIALPSPPPPPIPARALLPRLPPQDDQIDRSPDPSRPSETPLVISGAFRESGNALHLVEGDIQATAKFVREFVVQSLVPWMERSVLEWNEAVSDINYERYSDL
jgi:hypothetical protein